MYRILDSRRQFQVFQYLRQLLVLETGCYYGLQYLVIFYLEYYVIMTFQRFQYFIHRMVPEDNLPVLPSRVIFGIHVEHLDLASALLILGFLVWLQHLCHSLSSGHDVQLYRSLYQGGLYHTLVFVSGYIERSTQHLYRVIFIRFHNKRLMSILRHLEISLSG